MEELGFDVSGILTDEEADKLFEELDASEQEQGNDENNTPAEEEQENPSEEVGEEEEKESEEDVVTDNGDGSSPNVYSSIASALKDDGIFPDLTEEDIAKVTTPEAFAELFEKTVTARLDERQRRIDEALGNGVEPDTVRQYEQTLEYLGSITEEALKTEGEEGENLRRQLIYNDLITRGYSKEKAARELEKSFKSNSDLEDAKDALEALTKHYTDEYQKVQADAKKRVEEAKENQKKQAESLRKMIVEDEFSVGDTKLDKRTRQKIYDAISKPVHKDAESGRLMTAVQKFQKDNPLEFLRQIGMWYVLTDGGKNFNGLTKAQVRAEKNRSIAELERKINTSSLKKDGSLQYSSSVSGTADPLLSDDWKVVK